MSSGAASRWQIVALSHLHITWCHLPGTRYCRLRLQHASYLQHVVFTVRLFAVCNEHLSRESLSVRSMHQEVRVPKRGLVPEMVCASSGAILCMCVYPSGIYDSSRYPHPLYVDDERMCELLDHVCGERELLQ